MFKTAIKAVLLGIVWHVHVEFMGSPNFSGGTVEPNFASFAKVSLYTL